MLSATSSPLCREPESDPLVTRAKALDKHYISTRYPNGFASGAPMDYYTTEDAERAIDDAEAIVRFCENLLAGSGRDP